MTDSKLKIAVCSRSFSRHSILRQELLSKYKNVTFNDSGEQLEGESLVEFLKNHDKAITALEKIDESILSQLPKLKAIGKYGVGLDMIDMKSMNKNGVRLGWVAGVNRRSVSELTLSLMINMLRHVHLANSEVKSGIWRQLIGRQLTGATVGIIGCGNVGQDLVRLLRPFECNILVNDIVDYSEFYEQYDIQAVTLPELMTMSDIISIHIPLNRDTTGILDAKMLSRMKGSAILINTARGGLVDEVKLKDMLKRSKISGAAFDVFNSEPPTDSELLSLTNFFATPHIGGSSEEAVLAMGRAAIYGLEHNSVPQV